MSNRRDTRHLPLVLPAALILFLMLAPGPLAAQPAAFRRGDANADASIDISDAVRTLQFLFGGADGVPCADAADSNDDGVLDISDPVFTLSFLFLGGPEPPEPGMRCGLDPTADGLDCAAFLPCGSAGEPLRPRLRPAGGCEEVLQTLRLEIAAEMNSVLDQNLQLALEIAKGGGCWGWLMDDCPTCGFGPGPVPVPAASPGDSASDYSTTNNQVEGVDEADFLKNDGRFIYILAGGRFQIIDAWPAPEARRIAAVDIEGDPRKLLVHGDRAVVYSSLEPLRADPGPQPGIWGGWGMPLWNPGPSYGECTYGYDCEFTGDGRRLKATVFDIADRAAPRLLRELEFSGSYLAARRIGDMVHTVVIFPEVIVPGLIYWPKELENFWEFCGQDPFPYTEEEVTAMFDLLRAENAARIDAASIADFLPSIMDTRYEGGVPATVEALLQDCEDFYLSPAADGRSLLSLVTFEIGALEDPAATTVVGKPGAVYASVDSLYVATRHYRWESGPWFFDDRELFPEATAVHKFRLHYDRAGSSYEGSGVVKGRILNQFSMDEHDGFLRIAATTGHAPSPEAHSGISVLAEAAEGLELVGLVDGLAPSEDIRSVRFHGDICFLVTFKKTDPLFVIDISEPTAPRVRGELKIPGFSTYMHMLDDHHILSIGYDASDQGSFAWFQGVLLQIFDVADLDGPRLLHRTVIGTRGTTSDAATNHLAFNFFRPRSLLAIPMAICEGEIGSGRYGDRLSFNGLLVYRAGIEKGFELLGGVPHSEPLSGTAAAQFCSNWWTRSNSQVKRSVFMDDFVYSVALDRIQVSHTADLEHPVASVNLKE